MAKEALRDKMDFACPHCETPFEIPRRDYPPYGHMEFRCKNIDCMKKFTIDLFFIQAFGFCTRFGKGRIATVQSSLPSIDQEFGMSILALSLLLNAVFIFGLIYKFFGG